MTAPEGRPRLRPGCRLSPAGDVLLIPEGALRLQGPARRILQFCDGTRIVQEIIENLLEEFPGADPVKVAEDTATFLVRLFERAAIEFV